MKKLLVILFAMLLVGCAYDQITIKNANVDEVWLVISDYSSLKGYEISNFNYDRGIVRIHGNTPRMYSNPVVSCRIKQIGSNVVVSLEGNQTTQDDVMVRGFVEELRGNFEI